jgi:uncharacterized protein (DUF1015 family)
MTDRGTDFKPASVISNVVKEIDRLDISDTHHRQEQCERLEIDTGTEKTKHRRSDKERNEDFDDLERAH